MEGGERWRFLHGQMPGEAERECSSRHDTIGVSQDAVPSQGEDIFKVQTDPCCLYSAKWVPW